MFLSRLMLDPERRSTRELLINHYLLHQAVYRAFPDATAGGPGRVLYRVDIFRNGDIHLLVQSEKKPLWDTAELLHACSILPVQSRTFAPSFFKGQLLFFMLRANPSIKKKTEGKKNGIRLGLVREEDQIDWLKRKGQNGGFSLCQCTIMTENRVQATRDEDSHKNISHLGVKFEGILDITDETLFLNSVSHGIGSAKGFGFGLLSVAPLTN